MAATNNNEREPTEAHADSVIIPKVFLPDERVLRNYALGWDNFVYDEITFLLIRFNLEGNPSEFELEWRNHEEGPTILDRKQVVEFYNKKLLTNCTITLVSNRNAPLGLPAMGVKPKEEMAIVAGKEGKLQDEVETTAAS